MSVQFLTITPQLPTLDLPKSLLIRRTTEQVCFLLRDRGTDTSSAFLYRKRSINPIQSETRIESDHLSRRTRAFKCSLFNVNALDREGEASYDLVSTSIRANRFRFSTRACMCMCVCVQLGLEDFTVFSRALSHVATGNDRDAGRRSIVWNEGVPAWFHVNYSRCQPIN